MQRNLMMCLMLAGITLASLWPVGRLGFIGYDDLDYVYQNPHVRSGLNLDNIAWALTAADAGNWHPLTWLSLMLDCQLFGLNPHEEHWVNLGFHAANTLLLFFWLQQLTGARWRSFLVAALFAVHPLHVQSVAWIAERKDVLSGFFALLTLLAYTRYCRDKTSRQHVMLLLLFALGLMAKPMLVTLPLVMLLLDFWPLGRTIRATQDEPQNTRLNHLIAIWRPLLAEKTPLFVLCLASCLLTFWAQSAGEAVISLRQIGWPERFLHAALAYCLYLDKLFWPLNLAIFYPYPRIQQGGLIYLGAFMLLIILSVAGIWRRRSQPYLVVGWFWFVIMLVPVIGLVQVGAQSMADRYAYLPSIGIFIIVAWGITETTAGSRSWSTGMAWLGAVTLLACVVDTRHQLVFWRNNITLFKHSVEVTPQDNFQGFFYLGISYGEAGDLADAAASLSQALQDNPNFEMARSRLGNVLILQKQYAAAESQFREILKSNPEDISTHLSLGLALSGQEKDPAAQAEYQTALLLSPGNTAISQILAANTRRVDAELALTNLTEQLRTNATPDLHMQMAEAHTVLGQYPRAVDHYQKALSLVPDSPVTLNNLAWLLATCPDATARDGKRAVALAEQACALTQDKKTMFLGTLAAAYAEAGRFDDAINTAQKACTNAANLGEADLLGSNQSLLALYQQHRAYHEPGDQPADTDSQRLANTPASR